MILFILYLVVYSWGWRKRVNGVVVCEERETINKIKKIWYFNKILCKIDNLMWGVLKSMLKKKILMLK